MTLEYREFMQDHITITKIPVKESSDPLTALILFSSFHLIISTQQIHDVGFAGWLSAAFPKLGSTRGPRRGLRIPTAE